MTFYDEKEAIIGVLEFAGRLLEQLMSRLPPEDLALFQDAWFHETKSQLDEAIGMLRGQPREEDIRRRAYEMYQARGREHGRDFDDWERAEAEIREELTAEDGRFRRFLQRVGLAGKSLKLKLQYLAEAASKGWRLKLLNLLNKFLGSLVSGVPGAEAVKELKEWLEGLLENQPDPDAAISSIYYQAGSDPFRLATL